MKHDNINMSFRIEAYSYFLCKQAIAFCRVDG